jgi:uncharacterized DUF497 family protein
MRPVRASRRSDDDEVVAAMLVAPIDNCTHINHANQCGHLRGFRLGEGNRAKCQKHGVSVAEIEALFAGPPFVTSDASHSLTEARVRAVGRTSAEKYLFVVFTVRERDGQSLIRPISARYMHRKEIRRYEETKA